MSEVNEILPQRSAGEVVLPSTGTTYWMQTLNTSQKERAQEEATWAGRRHVQRFKKGGSDYPALLDQFKGLPAQKQAEYIAGQKGLIGEYAFKAWEAHADPPKPEADTSEGLAALDKQIETWERKCKGLEKKRSDMIDSLYDTEVERALGMKPQERLEKCLELWIEEEFQKWVADLRTLWTIRFALRDQENHRQFIFQDEDVETLIMDLDDEDRQALVKAYHDIDHVSVRDVPTSPADS